MSTKTPSRHALRHRALRAEHERERQELSRLLIRDRRARQSQILETAMKASLRHPNGKTTTVHGRHLRETLIAQGWEEVETIKPADRHVSRRSRRTR